MDPQRRFSWKKLPPDLRTLLSDVAGVKPNANDAVWSAALGDSPDAKLLAEQWVDLRDNWLYYDLPNARTLSKALMDRGLGHPHMYGRSRREVYQYLCSCRSSPTLVEELDDLLWQLGGVRPRAAASPTDRDDTPIEDRLQDERAYAGLRRWAAPENAAVSSFLPYQHQEEAWAALDQAMAEARQRHPKRGLRGLLVLPTGAGKTATATRWLCGRYLKPGNSRPVLWIAHRAELLEQAALSFGQQVDVAGRDRSDPLDVQCLSSRHGRGADRLLDPEVEVSCASIFTLVSGDNELIVEQFLRRNPTTFIVIDEAHHAGARSYRWLLEVADQHKGIDVLGLTATPTRTAERERGWIASLFPDGIIYDADLATLISKGVLARPYLYEVDTGEEVVLTPKERDYLQQFSDYSPQTLDRLANSIGRNAAIVDEYMNRRDVYQQTLVFATSVAHAMTLAEQFNKAGVTADYVTHLSEPGHPKAGELIADFVAGKVNVLTSVTKLTEGVDLPNASTVFLARPTRSEILLKQMVGRALRGPAARGTKDAHLVSFADHWEDYADWLDPRSLFPAEEIIDESAKVPPSLVSTEVPWELYRELARQVRQLQFSGSVELVPAGWFDLSAFEGEQDNQALRLVPVYDHQRDGFDVLLDAVDTETLAAEGELVASCFESIPAPWPTEAAAAAMVRYVAELQVHPPFVAFADRDDYLPQLVAHRFVQEGHTNDMEYAIHVWDTTRASIVFPDKGTYVRAVRRHVEDLQLDGEGLDDWVPVDLTEELKQPLKPGSWDLVDLRDEVHREMGLEKPPPPISWTPRPRRHYWGQYDGQTGRITINAVLQTESISREALKMLVYHELLHHELGVDIGHRGEFRPRERTYPNWAALSAELDGISDYFRSGEPQSGR